MTLEPLKLTDARAMRALTHPVRLALVEALSHAGRPLTATEAGERIGESPTTCSFHLRQLARYGFVEEAERGPGRRRPWQLTAVGISFTDSQDDAESAVAAKALGRLMRERWVERARVSYEEVQALPEEWRDAGGFNQFVLYLTRDELRAVEADVVAVLARHHDRAADPALRPPGSRPVEALAFLYPVRLPGADA